VQKLRYEILDKLIESNVTSTEIDFLIYVSRYQNDSGIARGIYYKDLCSELGISFQSFYDLKASLSTKGIIKAEKHSYFDWDIEILDNDFSNVDYEEVDENGKKKVKYINTNHNIFYQKEFYGLKANEKILAMDFMKNCLSGYGSHDIGTQNFYDKYTNLLGVTKRMLQSYMQALKCFFSIGIKDKKYWITPLANVRRKFGAKTEIETYRGHIGEIICRRSKIKTVKEQEKKDTVDLLKQYLKSVNGQIDKLEDLLFIAVQKSIEKANAGVHNVYKWVRQLQPKLVHLCLREQLEEIATLN